MFKRNNISTYMVAAGLMTVATSSAIAQQAPVQGTATVTVQNTFQISQTNPLDFGTLRVTQPEAQVNGGAAGSERPTFIRMPTDGSAPVATAGTSAGTPGPTTNASITSLVDGSPALFNITGASTFTNLRIATGAGEDELTTVTTNSVTGLAGQVLRQGGDTTNTSFFTMYAEADDTTGDIRVVGGTNNDALYNPGSPNLRTDGTGAVGFLVGGTLAYNPAATGSPPEGTYDGTFTVTVSY